MHNRWHPDIEPEFGIRSGDILTLACQDGAAGQLTRASTHSDVASIDRGLAHPLAGPVYVEGAKPGDTLQVEFISFELDNFGFTPIAEGSSFLGDQFPAPYLVKWEIADGLARAKELPGVAVPERAFAGVAGVAPSHESLARYREREDRLRVARGLVPSDMPESAHPPSAVAGLRTIPPRENGGNIDIRGLVAGSRLWLTIQVDGALFSIGDLHFAQGDGEVCGWAVEVAGDVTVRLTVQRRNPRLRGVCLFPAYELPPFAERAYFATTGLPVERAMDLTAAARAALLEMINWLSAIHGFRREAAYALCSACVDLRLSQVVNDPYPLISAMLPLDIFEELQDRGQRAILQRWRP